MINMLFNKDTCVKNCMRMQFLINLQSLFLVHLRTQPNVLKNLNLILIKKFGKANELFQIFYNCLGIVLDYFKQK